MCYFNNYSKIKLFIIMSDVNILQSLYNNINNNNINDYLINILKLNNINFQDKTGRTVLHYLCLYNFYDGFNILLNNKDINVNLKDAHCQTPLILGLYRCTFYKNIYNFFFK